MKSQKKENYTHERTKKKKKKCILEACITRQLAEETQPKKSLILKIFQIKMRGT